MLHLVNLEEARALMLEEIEHAAANGELYISDRLNASGAATFPQLLEGAARNYDDDWLKARLTGMFNPSYIRRNPKTGGPVVVKMPINAADMLAEGEFNRFYIRGLCRLAIQTGRALVIYRAKQVSQPRPESEARIGRQVDPEALLNDLRNHIGLDTALGVPAGPNSGLSVKLV
jgi:hypothetical protein